jgi:hypothetical protein
LEPWARVSRTFQWHATSRSMELLTNEWLIWECICSYCSVRDLLALELVSKSCWEATRSEHVWRRAALSFFATKAFIPSLAWRLCTSGNSHARRVDLEVMSLSELHGLATQRYGIWLGNQVGLSLKPRASVSP